MKNIFLNVKIRSENGLVSFVSFSLDEKLLPPLKTNTYGTRKASLSLVFLQEKKKRNVRHRYLPRDYYEKVSRQHWPP
jgi:hypothetical protein